MCVLLRHGTVISVFHCLDYNFETRADNACKITQIHSTAHEILFKTLVHETEWSSRNFTKIFGQVFL